MKSKSRLNKSKDRQRVSPINPLLENYVEAYVETYIDQTNLHPRKQTCHLGPNLGSTADLFFLHAAGRRKGLLGPFINLKGPIR